MAVQVSKDIEAINNFREKAFETGVIWDFVDCFADDVVWMPNGGVAVVGKEACKEWAKQLDGIDFELSTISEEIVVAGDWAFERFVEIQSHIQDNGTKSPPTYLQCMWTLRRKVDNAWEAVHFIWNNNPNPNE